MQVRTHLQGQWANLFERAADVFGRQIRYDEPAADPEAQQIVQDLIDLSTQNVARMELVRQRLQRLRLADDDARRGIVPTSTVQNQATVRKRHQSSRNSERQLMEAMERMRKLFDLMQHAKEQV